MTTSGRLAAAGVVLLTLAAFQGVGANAFLNYDDDVYVTGNAHVASGFSAANAAWAMTTFQAANWHPITWISHMLDVSLFGLDPAGHHRMSLAIHTIDAVLLLLLWQRMTGALWRPALVAALFAIHPLHVQSVAWIAERKDVLSTLFWLLTTLAWLRYLDARSPGRYAAVILLFAAGLMAKPMLVTLPLTLMLLDVWPLGRAARPTLWREKAPLLVMSAASAAITVIAQHRGGAVQSFTTLPFPARLANAITGYAWYLVKMVWPSPLAYFYGHAARGPWVILGSAVVLITITALVLRLSKGSPHLLFGWAWYAITLFPVIGLVQVGEQSVADRYGYIPLIGIFVAVAWSLGAVVEARPRLRAVTAAAAVAWVGVLVPLTRAEVAHWRDNRSLFTHGVAVAPNSAIVRNNLAGVLNAEGRTDEAVLQLEIAVRLDPNDWPSRFNLGSSLYRLKRLDEAVRELAVAAAMSPGNAEVTHALAEARNDLGTARAREGRLAEALQEFEAAVKLDPGFAPARENLARAQSLLGTKP